MRQMSAIARREMKVLFFSPIGWLVLIVFCIQLGSLLSANLSSRTYSVWGISEISTSLTYNILYGNGASLIPGIASELYLYIPLLTMGLLSREFGEGTMKLLLSSPVRVRDIVLGKYFSMMGYAGVLVGFIGVLGILLGLFVIDNPDIGLYLWSLFLVFLVICAYAAIGLYVSSLTNYQFVAAIGTVGVLFFLNYASRLSVAGSDSVFSAILIWLQGFSSLSSFKGFVGSWEILFFVLVITLFLGLCYLRLQNVRNPGSWWKKAMRVAMLVFIVISLGYISSRPSMKYYADVRSSEVSDTKILIDRTDVPTWRFLLMQGIPVIFLITGSIMVIRRSRQ